MKRRDVKSYCPINYTLEIFGDPWSLIIIRGMLNYGAKHFGDFLKSEERIGTSVLSDRLAHLEKNGIISKHPDKEDTRRTTYHLTPQGIKLIPMLYEIAAWGTAASAHPKAAETWFKALRLPKQTVITAWERAIESDSAFYVGANSVVKQLEL